MTKRLPYELDTAKNDAAPIFWKSLEQKADPIRAAKEATAEFPREAVLANTRAGKSDESTDTSAEIVGPVGRRGFLFGGMSAALLAVEGCARRPVENILPYSKAPEYMLPGIPVHYATVRAHRGDSIGMIVENHEGRPTKLEGNPEHPGSFGGLDASAQASILELYDPDRSNGPKTAGKDAKWEQFEAFLKTKVASFAGDGGAKLRFLMAPTNSPTFLRMRDALAQKLPHARVHTWTPVNESNAHEGARLAFGQPITSLTDFRFAKVVVALDSDFLQTEPGMIRATKLFARSRRIRSSNEGMSRLYVVEPSYTTTGANADHRLRLPARQIEPYVLALAKELASRPGLDLVGLAPLLSTSTGVVDGVPPQWIKAVADELFATRGRSAIMIGTRQPARLHALVYALNGALGNLGTTISSYPILDSTERDVVADLKDLTADMDAGRVDTLVLFGGNPVFDAPADLKFADKLAKVPTTIHLAHSLDETGSKCTWHLPRAHELETWGDQRSLDGSLGIQQPMISPLFGGRSDIELLALFTGDAPNGYDLVHASFKGGGVPIPTGHEQEWKKALNRGLIAGAGAHPLGETPAKSADIVAAFPRNPPPRPLALDNLEIQFSPDPKLFDGRYGNNPWLLELPDLMTKICWDNAALLSPATAKALGVANGDLLSLSREGVGAIEIPAWILPGQADNTVAVTVGWGRAMTGRYGTGAGFNTYPLRTTDALGFSDGAKIAKTGKTWQLVQTQEHNSMEGRPLAIDTTLAEYKKQPNFGQYKTPDPKTLPLWKPVEYNGHKWGMVIDLSSCTGCDVCVIACQSENNIATVGKEQVYRNREMYWIRIDRYFLGEDESNPPVAIQPVACVQCEDAPCENVCPVNATAHSPEGLNDMAYNRCIGTRYCANNCPYKVRRFNYLEFEGGPIGSTADTMYGDIPETRKMQFNPDVTVRMRGVMEKCTYCVQRIQEGKISAKRDDKTMIKDGEIVTACQQSCPADAIIFGDLNDPQSRVAHYSKIDRGYHLLSELGTHPRTTYLGKIRNPNPAMEQG